MRKKINDVETCLKHTIGKIKLETTVTTCTGHTDTKRSHTGEATYQLRGFYPQLYATFFPFCISASVISDTDLQKEWLVFNSKKN